MYATLGIYNQFYMFTEMSIINYKLWSSRVQELKRECNHVRNMTVIATKSKCQIPAVIYVCETDSAQAKMSGHMDQSASACCLKKLPLNR